MGQDVQNPLPEQGIQQVLALQSTYHSLVPHVVSQGQDSLLANTSSRVEKKSQDFGHSPS
jgi:hypothetical protein